MDDPNPSLHLPCSITKSSKLRPTVLLRSLSLGSLSSSSNELHTCHIDFLPWRTHGEHPHRSKGARPGGASCRCGVAPRAIKRHGHRLLVLGRSSNAATPMPQQETVRPLRAWAARGWPASMRGARQAARGWQASTGGARQATSLEISPFLFSRMCRKEKR